MLMRRSKAPSQTTITLFVLLVLQVATMPNQSGEVLIPPEDQTVPVGSVAEFFCQVRGDHEQLRINAEILYDINAAPRPQPEGILYQRKVIDMNPDEGYIIDINVTIEATVDRNNTVISCAGVDHNPSPPSTAVLTVRGAPAIPEVDYDLLSPTELHLSWSPPFTWDNYGILGYRIRCVNYTNGHVLVKETVNNTTLSYDYTLPEDALHCSQMSCNVTASNSLGESGGSNLTIQFPVAVASPPEIAVDSIAFSETRTPRVTFCIKLPVLCSFQELSYTITITSEDKQSMQRSRETMNGSEDCIIQEFAEGLVEGIEYTAVVFIDTGPLTGNSSSRTLTFKAQLRDDEASNNASTAVTMGWSVGAGVLFALLFILCLSTVCIWHRRQTTKPEVTAYHMHMRTEQHNHREDAKHVALENVCTG